MKRHSIIYMALLLSFFCAALSAREPLTFEQRVKAQEAIEKVYYSHRIWPKENPGPKPPFDKMVSKETIEAEVTDYLKKSAVLEKYWYRPITGEQLQAEMDRMAKGTKDPATLNELFEALNNDPYLIAECLARPVLADRVVRNWYQNDERFHGETKKKAEDALKTLTAENFCQFTEAQYSKMTYKLEANNETERLDPEDRTIKLSEKEFEKMLKEVPDKGKISGVIEKDDCFVIMHTVEKNEIEMEIESVVFKKTGVEEFLKKEKASAAPVKAETEKNYYMGVVEEEGCEERWDNGSLDDVPDPRVEHKAVWTGSEMIVWGGMNSEGLYNRVYLNSGRKYNPATDSWCPTSTGANVPSARISHTVVWTGTEMIVWGGYSDTDIFNTGGRYDPLSDSWIPTPVGVDTPSIRHGHVAVWTGSEMIIWGGGGPEPSYLLTGGRYNPATEEWTCTSTNNVPEGRAWSTAIWTGSEMIVWGGSNGSYLNTGGRYNPLTDTWLPTSTAPEVPLPRLGHSAIWTGTEMVIWGGSNYDFLKTGGRYTPLTDSWLPTSIGENVPDERYNHTAIWTGTEMIIWGGMNSNFNLKTGGKYSLSSDSWTPTATEVNCPSARERHTAVWTGTEMIIWGGRDFSNNCDLNTGGRYNPQSDIWVPTSTGINVPSERREHIATWTGSEMIVWGGVNNYSILNTGGRYNPSIDTWIPSSTGTNCPSARYDHTAVWTGNEMIVWGGVGSDRLKTGGRYNPLNDTWAATSTGANCPSKRTYHTALWTGSEMIIWGGAGSSPTCKQDGGRYNFQSDSWLPTSMGVNCPSARFNHTAIWAENEMIVWGGNDGNYLDTGGRYNPLTNAWSTTSTGTECPSARCGHTAVWTGTEMVVWGGEQTDSLNGGGRYDPLSDAWDSTSIGADCPDARYYHTAIWTGSEMIVWGGYTSYFNYALNTGGRYNPLADIWLPTQINGDTPSRRDRHASVWTGSYLIVWGGYNNSYLRSGGMYSPGTSLSPYLQGDCENECPLAYANLLIPGFYSSYQWSLDGSPISGATSNTYEATSSGNYTVSVTDSNGCSGTSDPHVVTITPCIPNIVYSSHGSFSEITGDGDSYFEKGEKWSVPVTVTNTGNTPATGVTAQLSGNGITVCNDTGSFGTIAAGGTGTFTYNFVIDDDFTPCGGSINFNLGSKTCTELTPAGTDETNLFSVQVGQIAAGVPTDLVVQPSNADSYVNQSSAGTNYGTAPTMLIQARNAQARRSLVRFDISAMPEGSTINSATLELYATTITGGLTLNVHRITGTWTETGVTWTNQPSFTSTADASITGGTSTGWKIWDVASVVQQWVGGTENYGFIVKAETEIGLSTVTNIFASKENATTGNRPILRINYTPPTSVNCDYVGSGECDAVLAECAPGDTYENGQMWSGTSHNWPALSGATGYKLYRGVQSGLQYLLTADNDSCLRYEGAATSIDLLSDDPSGETGRLYWYIVTGTNGSGEGPAGNGRIVNSYGNCE